MKLADKLDVSFAVVFGPDELAKGEAIVRDLATGEEKAVALTALPDLASKGFK